MVDGSVGGREEIVNHGGYEDAPMDVGGASGGRAGLPPLGAVLAAGGNVQELSLIHI